MPKSLFTKIDPPRRPTAVPSRRERLPDFLGAPADIDDRLDGLRVMCVGAGSVGAVDAENVARLQPAKMLVVDQARFKPESLLTQPILPQDVGRPKAMRVGQRCKQISPRTDVFVFDGPVQAIPAWMFAGFDYVALATDNLAAEAHIGWICAGLGVTVIQASVFGPMLVAQIRFHSHQSADSPCVLCGFGQGDWDHFNRGTKFSCQGGGHAAAATPAEIEVEPTQSTASLCGLAGNLLALQMLRDVAQLGRPVGDTLLEYSVYPHRTTISPLARKANCGGEHMPWRVVQQPNVMELTPRALFSTALGVERAPSGESLAVDDSQYAEEGVCMLCGRRQSIAKFVHALTGAGKCVGCGGAVDALSFYAHRPAPYDVLDGSLDRPLSRLAPTQSHTVVVRNAEQTVLFPV